MRIDEFYYKQPEPKFVDWLNSPLHEEAPELTKEDIPPIFYRHYPSYISGELNISELARVCNMSRTRVYRYIKVLK